VSKLAQMGREATVTEEKHQELEKDVSQQADAMEQTADEMEQRSSDLGDDVSDARGDWERKRRDPNVPGAPEPDEDTGKSPADAER
jgi:hypothetical protein